MLPLLSNSFEIILKTSSEMADLYHWSEAVQRPRFLLCLTKSLIK